MAVVIVTGSCGLVGSETAAHYAARGFDVIGIDNDLRRHFFGDAASTAWVRGRLEATCPRYRHEAIDIRDRHAIEALFERFGRDVALVVHAAAQPSHDWAATDPHMDFGVNAVGTLTLLDAVRRSCPEAPFVYLSTNKVYGDRPNSLPLVELDTRWELPPDHPRYQGIDESMSIDGSTHSLFGVSKAAADLLVQEYGRYFGLRTACLRGGCLTGPNHSGAMLHGFLAYLMKCVCTGARYTVFGYKGKQVRDNIHSADLIAAIDAFFASPRSGEVYNMGGGRRSNCSMLEAIALCEEIAGRPLAWTYRDEPRIGDHIWYVSDLSRFQAHYPGWQPRVSLRALLEDIYQQNISRWASA
ncbi:MAG: NAD-dependent epimerase/dehydratase family protein [Vicinamibacterales bacterium]